MFQNYWFKISFVSFDKSGKLNHKGEFKKEKKLFYKQFKNIIQSFKNSYKKLAERDRRT